MNFEEIRKLLDLVSFRCELDLVLGLNAFIERAYVWSEGFNILIRYDAVNEDSFEFFISVLKDFNKLWRLVERADEPFFLIYSSNNGDKQN